MFSIPHLGIRCVSSSLQPSRNVIPSAYHLESFIRHQCLEKLDSWLGITQNSYWYDRCLGTLYRKKLTDCLRHVTEDMSLLTASLSSICTHLHLRAYPHVPDWSSCVTRCVALLYHGRYSEQILNAEPVILFTIPSQRWECIERALVFAIVCTVQTPDCTVPSSMSWVNTSLTYM